MYNKYHIYSDTLHFDVNTGFRKAKNAWKYFYRVARISTKSEGARLSLIDERTGKELAFSKRSIFVKTSTGRKKIR